MKYAEFKKRTVEFPVFSSSLLAHLGTNIQVLRNQLTRWEKRGLVHKLRKGLYVLNESDRKNTPSRPFLANQIYSPSYVSAEYALAFYDLIPERVADVTSVTTRKTYRVRNIFGDFIYQHIPEKAFSGFVYIKDETDHPYLAASPEKAVADFIYLNLSRFNADDPAVFEDSFRFQNMDALKAKHLRRYAALFESRKLARVINRLIALMEEKHD